MCRIALSLFVALVFLVPAQAQDWTAPVNISNTPGRFNWGPGYDFDADGYIHAAWNDFIDSSWRLYYATNRGGSWTKQLIHSHIGAAPQVIVTKQDQVIHIFYSKDGLWEVTKPVSGGSWSGEMRWDVDPLGGFLHTVAADEDDNILAVYGHLFDSDAIARNSMLARHRPFGGTWGPTFLVEGNSLDGAFPAHGHAAAYNGHFYLRYVAEDHNWYRVRYPDGGWSTRRSLAVDRFTFAPSGEMARIWTQNDGRCGLDFRIYASTSQDLGATWSPALLLSPGCWLARNPECTYDDFGNLHVLYQYSAQDYDDFDMWYVHRTGGVWSNASNLTNNGSRTGAPMNAVRYNSGWLHYGYADNENGGYEDAYFTHKFLGSPDTPIATPTVTNTFTITPTFTVTFTATQTFTATITNTPRPRTPSATPTSVPTGTPVPAAQLVAW